MTKEEAIKNIKEHCYFANLIPRAKEALDRAIKALEQKSRWISVNERLPKMSGVYRVTRYYPGNVVDSKYIIDAGFFDGSNAWYNDIRINHKRPYADNIIAWQENPEPYRAESEK